MCSQKKTIWIINQYASTPGTGMGGSHYCIARELTKQGYKVFLIAASFTHLLRNPPKLNSNYLIQEVEGVNFVWIKMPSYDNAHSKKRIFNWFCFAWRLLKLKHVITDKPDAILYSSPSLVGYLGAKRLAEGFKVPLTFEVRDIWPLSLTEIGGYSSRNPFIRFLQWVEDKAYRESDNIVSNLKNAVEHIHERGFSKDKFTWIPNGFSMEDVTSFEPLSEDIKKQLPNNKFIVGYAGTIGVANALDVLIQAAALLENCKDIVFVLVGGGRETGKLKKLVNEKMISNVIFIDPIPKSQVQSMLSYFDVCYIGLVDQPLFKYGVSPNKLFDYMFAGKPILYAINSGNYRPIDESRSGVSVIPGDVESHVKSILYVRALSIEDRKIMGDNANKYVVKNHEYGHLSKKIVDVIFKDSKV